jgi:hypothetical protein
MVPSVVNVTPAGTSSSVTQTSTSVKLEHRVKTEALAKTPRGRSNAPALPDGKEQPALSILTSAIETWTDAITEHVSTPTAVTLATAMQDGKETSAILTLMSVLKILSVRMEPNAPTTMVHLNALALVAGLELSVPST